MIEITLFLIILFSILSSGNFFYTKVSQILKIKTKQNFYFDLINIFSISLIMNYFIIWLVGLISIDLIFFISFYFLCLILFAKPFYLFLKENIIKQNKKFLDLTNDKKIIILAIIFYFIILLLNSAASPVDFDSLHYHLLIPKKYIEEGYINIDHAWGGFDFFPFLIEYFAIIFLLFNIESGIQLLNVFITLNIIFCIYNLGIILRINIYQNLLAIIFFILIKNIIWLSSTSHNELLLCFFYLSAFINLIKIFENKNYLTLFSIACVGLLYTKYLSLPLGLTFVPFIFYYFIINKNSINLKKIIILISPLLLFLPFLVRNYYLTSDPLYPLFELSKIKNLGYSSSIVAFLKSPFDIFFFANKYFDGKQIGSPYLICFFPLFFLFVKKYHFSNFLILSIVIYYTLWFYLLGRQVRFLVPIFPLISIISACGAINFINFCKNNYLKYLISLIIFIFFINQIFFLFAYSSIRIPSLFSFDHKVRYLNHSSVNHTTNYNACKFLENRLKKSESYISLNFRSLFYCPVTNSIYGKFNNFLEENLTFSKKKIENFFYNNNVKYVLLTKVDTQGLNVGTILIKKKIPTKQNEIFKNFIIDKKKIYEDNVSVIYILE